MATWWPAERADAASSMTCCILPKTSSILWSGWVLDTCTEHWAKIITPGLSHTLVSALELSVKKPSTESSSLLAWDPEPWLVPLLFLLTSDWGVCLKSPTMMLALTHPDIPSCLCFPIPGSVWLCWVPSVLHKARRFLSWQVHTFCGLLYPLVVFLSLLSH